LGAKRVFLVVEGMEVKHIHIKLYPVYKMNSSVSPKIIDTLPKTSRKIDIMAILQLCMKKELKTKN
jgi:hypothetical protein